MALTALQKAQQQLLALQGQKQMIDANYELQSDQLANQITTVTANIATLTAAAQPAV